ncbi:transferrin-binding protein-like solute binding protein [Lonepinella sp. MS14437]|uniref:transferrin-binding protein-like solute binding protein n=1 Tax=unclassified Lonepinella TaxID=2642006 RepID=UPI0036DD1172
MVAGANQYLFVQGTPTESTAVPTTGTAKYNGGFLRFASNNSDNLFQASGAITGNFTADVDFGDKTIEGQIRNGNGAPTTAAQPFKGNVSSNGFTANWTDSDTGSGLKGNFYGSTAEEVGGTFERSDSFGVFVGKK